MKCPVCGYESDKPFPEDWLVRPKGSVVMCPNCLNSFPKEDALGDEQDGG